MTTELIYQDQVGESARPPGPSFEDIGLSDAARTAFIETYGEGFQLSPPQVWSIENGLLEDAAHFLVSAATNSGKTLIAYLRMLHRLAEPGRRFVYVVPLKALAEEKAAELEQLCASLEANGGPSFKISKSTGDYQLTADFLGSPPPDSGEIVICTPERLEVIARDPDNAAWLKSVDTFVVDEFHLLGENGRGATVECLITRILTMCPDASIMALSATIGNPAELGDWLGHTGNQTHVLESEFRYPQLRRSIISVDDKNEYIGQIASKVLQEEQSSLLVFVYRKTDAERLAKVLREQLGEDDVIAHFHSGMSLTRRKETARRFQNGEIRILTTTTSLKMGINTPASHVIVRDTIFMGVGRLPTSDLLQMLGRAGRGDQAGEGIVLMSDQEEYGSYLDDLRANEIADIRAQLIPQEPKWSRGKTDITEPGRTDARLGAVLTEISRHEHLTLAELAAFFSHTYSAWSDNGGHHDYSSQIAFLVRDKLVFKVENSQSTYSPTKLGRTVAFSGLSPESGGMIGGFLRALIRLSEKRTNATGKPHDYLRRLSAMDLYLLTAASFECRQFVPSRISKKRRSEIEAYIEGLPPEDKPVTNLWRSAESDQYPTRRLLSSLRFPKLNNPKSEEGQFYRLMLTAMLLDLHARGHSLDQLAEDYGFDVGVLDSGLKSAATWVLHCIAQICNPERCYKLNFLSMKAYELVESLSFGSNLGKLLTVKGVGRKSVQKVLDAGIADMDGLRGCQSTDLVALGLHAGQAKMIARHVARTNR